MSSKRLGAVGAVVGFAALGAILGSAAIPPRVLTLGTTDTERAPAAEPANLTGDDPDRFVDCGIQPTGVLRAACRIGSAAYNVSGSYPNRGLDQRETFKAFAAIEAATFVRSSLSAARYSYLKAHAGARLPAGAEMCLEEGAGICGNHIEVFRAIMDALGIASRPISFFYTEGGRRRSHVAAEVHYLGAWRFIDVTWGFAVPLDGGILLKSHDEIRENLDHARTENAFDTWSIFARAIVGDPMAYLYRPDVDILIDGQGVVTLAVPKDAHADEPFDNVPNYVGDATPGGERRPTALRFVADGRYRVSLEISGMAGCAPDDGDVLEVNGRALPFAEASNVTFEFDEVALLSMRTTQPTCYVVFSEGRYEALH